MDIDEYLKRESERYQKRIIKGYLELYPDADEHKLLEHLKCIPGIGPKSIEKTKRLMEEIKNVETEENLTDVGIVHGRRM